MIHSVALVIADFFVSKDVITEEEKEVCAYGMELIIAGIISVALVLIIGLITGNIWYAVVYNIMMIVIRLYTGGYHADTHVGCNVCYCMAFIISFHFHTLIIADLIFEKSSLAYSVIYGTFCTFLFSKKLLTNLF